MAILEEKYWQAWLLLKDRTAVKEVGRRNQTLELRAEPLEVIPEKAGLEPKMVRFKPVLMMSRLGLGLRTDKLQFICNTVFHTWQVDDVARELPNVGELSLLTSRPGWSCSE